MNTQEAALDPITLEVLRHRLMMINDEQGRVASMLSGSPVVYDAKDFNSALLTAGGDSLFIGIYMTRLSLCLNHAVKSVITRFGADSFADGDAYVTNDPWAGAAHMNDILMFAPIFHEGTLVCWTGLAMHEVDVGGPNPGSFTVGTPDVYGEAPLIPPVKMIDAGRIRADVEALIIRNSRTSQLNGLNLRARIAAIDRTRERVREVIAEYGLASVMAAQTRILELVAASFSRRLNSLPDGTWLNQAFLDHDGNTNHLYRLQLALTKRGDRLIFDFTGTDKQARGAINCTRVGLESGVFSAILPQLCYDIPWSPGGLIGNVDIISEPGTINNALHPAAVSMATVSAIFATAHVCYGAIAKLLACADLTEAQANWAPAWQGATLAGHHEDGRRFTAVLLDNTGGSGARAWKDGIDAGGLPGAPAMAIGNVETYEKEHPILYVLRRQAPDTGGPGRWRGGVGTEVMIAPHGNAGPIDLTVLTHGASQPEGLGLYGGYPGSVQVRLLLRETDLAQEFAASRVPLEVAAMTSRSVDSLEAKQRTLMQPTDVLVAVCAGGGGYGDPLHRPPHSVRDDVEARVVGLVVARDIYGVVLREEAGVLAVDEAGTLARRAAIRAERATGTPADHAAPAAQGAAVERPIGMASLVADGVHVCAQCRTPLALRAEDPKQGARQRVRSIECVSAWNSHGLTEEIQLREFTCPTCEHLLGVQVARTGEPPMYDTLLA